jgi:simple sugar transport system permease protein
MNRTLINLIFIGIGGVAVYLILNAVIGGQCDAECVTDTIAQMVRVATPVALAAYCGVLCERSAVIDIGIEGKMLMAAMVAYAIDIYTYNALKDGGMNPETAGAVARWLGLVLGVLSGGFLAWLHAVVSIRFKTDQIISGTVVNILAIGVTGYMYRQFLAENVPTGPGTFSPLAVPRLSANPFLGPTLSPMLSPILDPLIVIFFQQKPIVYLMLMLALVLHVVLLYTPWGLRTRAVGEHPKAADTLGVDVLRTRYVNVFIAGLIAGLGGAWFTLEAVDVFNPLMTNGLGFIGLAAMIFGNWMPVGALMGAFIFGLGNSVQATISLFRPDIPSQFPQMLPYLLTIIVLTGVVGHAAPPAADGQPYEKQ